MKEVFIASDNILTPLGGTTAENLELLKKNVSGIKHHEDPQWSSQPFFASMFEREDCFFKSGFPAGFTPFEQLLIGSISDAVQNSGVDIRDQETIVIISTTKGNIGLLESGDRPPEWEKRLALTSSARVVSDYFQLARQPLVVSNACISGLVALLTGRRLIRSGQYKNVVVAGADVLSKFILSGFQSFLAVSPEPCRPFDAARKGITLGEGAGTVVLSSDRKFAGCVRLAGGAVSNDANHISGPSRTGEELCLTMQKSLQEAGLEPGAIDFLSAHGTATQYNDEMEAKAISLAGLATVPVNSLKGYFGHTLGAAGLIESIVAVHSLKENVILPTRGFQQLGVSQPINVSLTMQSGYLRNCLKTASGFGGCNASVVLSKQD